MSGVLCHEGHTTLRSMAYRSLLYRLHGALHDTVTIRTRQGRLTMPTHDDGIGRCSTETNSTSMMVPCVPSGSSRTRDSFLRAR